MNCALQYEAELPFTVAANSTQTFDLQMNPNHAGSYAQQIHFFLEVGDRTIDKAISISGMATQAPDN